MSLGLTVLVGETKTVTTTSHTQVGADVHLGQCL